MDRVARLSLLWMTCLGLAWGNVGLPNDSPVFDEASLDFFEKEVRPILAARCFECHADKGTPKGGLRLDSRDALLKGGDTGPAVALDQPSESLFISSINYGDIYQMPPKSKLPAGEIAVLTKWVTLGLPWPKEAVKAGTVKPFDLAARTAEHWCWQPVASVDVPVVADTNWPISNVDHFILSKLEAAGISPAPQADRRTLLRRIYFDLIGLPPSPDEVERFASDQNPRALEEVVDRLLGSVQFGERWARHWLDLTRYAETRGHEFEPIIPNAWQYRDYVIRAISADVPYDRFLTEQIAGDLLEPRWRGDVGLSWSGRGRPLTPALSPQGRGEGGRQRANDPPILDPSDDANKEPLTPALSPRGRGEGELATNESMLGTGFWFLGEEVHSPVDIRKDETDRIDNRLDVMTKTFLGLTVSCARCHDHKFDAISQRDYYALAGFALGGSYRQVRIDTFEQHRQMAVRLDEQRTKARRVAAKSLVESSQPVVGQLSHYWLAAKQIIEAGASNESLVGDKLLLESSGEIIRQLAAEKQLDAALLTRWCRELDSAKQDARHLLHRLFDRVTDSTVSGTTENAKGQDAVATTAQLVANPRETIAGLVVDFGDPGFSAEMQDGVSFGLKPVARGQLIMSTSENGSTFTIAKIGGWERDLFWKNIKLAANVEVDHGTLGAWQTNGRMVRSPEFTLNKQRVWYLVRGSVRAYASVNSHLIVAGPLHGSVFREYKHSDNDWHWVSHDLAAYDGHRMHVEFSPADDAPCAIAMVVQSDEQPPLPGLNSDRQPLDLASGKTGEDRLAAYADAFRSVIESLKDGEQVCLEEIDQKKTTTPHPASPHKAGARSQTSTLDDHDQVLLADWFVSHLHLFCVHEVKIPDSGLNDFEAELAQHVQWESSLAPAMLEGNGVDELLLVRGNSNTPKDPVPRRFLEAIGQVQLPLETSELREVASVEIGSGRKQLAEAMLQSPLAARVAVNRIWHHLFGRGIVPTVDNMGVLGLPPSHPELLDYLATEFVQNGWSTKAMIRSLILTQTYQMSSRPTDVDGIDPGNQLLHRMTIKRLEGEAIRDSLLAVSGRLDPTPFGPSVPIHLTEFMQGRGRPGASGPLDGNGRRSIYIAIRRNFLSPMMLAFDTPSPFSTVGRRTISNVPAQALILMNDPFVVEQANRWAECLLSDHSQSTEQRLDRLYLMAFARHPTPAESAEATHFLKSQATDTAENQRAAWGHLCHVMFNVKEFVFVE